MLLQSPAHKSVHSLKILLLKEPLRLLQLLLYFLSNLEAYNSVVSKLLEITSGRDPHPEVFLSDMAWTCFSISLVVINGVLGRFTRPTYSIFSSLLLSLFFSTLFLTSSNDLFRTLPSLVTLLTLTSLSFIVIFPSAFTVSSLSPLTSPSGVKKLNWSSSSPSLTQSWSRNIFLVLQNRKVEHKPN